MTHVSFRRLMRLCLASNSQRRMVMLSDRFETVVQEGLDGVDETPPIGTVDHQVLTICRRKADAVHVGQDGVVVVVADTMIADPDDMSVSLGKPLDMTHAASMLVRLQGRRHQVWTATGVHAMGTWTFWCEAATVSFPEFPTDVLDELLQSGSWKGKAGAYDLHGAMGEHARLVDGEACVVLGLAQGALESLEVLNAAL